MTTDGEKLLKRWFEEVWNKGREDAIVEMFDTNGVAVCPNNPPEKPVQGVEAFKAYFQHIRKFLFDIKATVEDFVVEGEKITALCRIKASKRDESGGDAHTEIEVSGLCIVKIKDGKIVYAWNNLDFSNI